MLLAHLRRRITPSSDKRSPSALFFSTKGEKGSRNVPDVRPASKPAGPGGGAGGCAAGDVCHLPFTCPRLSCGSPGWCVVCRRSRIASVRRREVTGSGASVSPEEAGAGTSPPPEEVRGDFPPVCCGCLKANPCFPAGGGYRTGAAGGPKTRTWSLTRTRRSRLLFLLQQPMRAKPEIS